MFARSFYLSTFSAEVHLQGEKDEVNCKCCIKFSSSVTGDQQLESGKKIKKKNLCSTGAPYIKKKTIMKLKK